MESITLTIYRQDIYDEVDKTADYTGAKLIQADPSARDRIAVTQTDLKTLSRFWVETCVAADERLKEMLISSSSSDENYVAQLQVSVAFDKNLSQSVLASLRSFFIMSITGKWYVFANKGDAPACFAEANALMEDVRRKLYSRRMIKSPRKKNSDPPYILGPLAP